MSWSGQVPLGLSLESDPAPVVDRLAAALIGLRARVVQRSPGAVEFRAGMLRLVSNRNLLAPIRRGRVEVVRGPRGLEAHYRISFAEVVVVATLMVGLMAAHLAIYAGPEIGAVRFVVPPLAWLWLVGGNIAITLDRFPRFVRRVGSGIEPPDR